MGIDRWEGIRFSGTQASGGDYLIRGICFINITPLFNFIDIGAIHYFIVVDYVKRLGLELSSMNGEMVIDLPAKGLVTTSLVHLRFPL